MSTVITNTDHGIAGSVRKFATINADHTPCGTRVMATVMIAVFVNAMIASDGFSVNAVVTGTARGLRLLYSKRRHGVQNTVTGGGNTSTTSDVTPFRETRSSRNLRSCANRATPAFANP